MNFFLYLATGLEKGRMKAYEEKVKREDDEIIYEISFVIPADFGPIGAVLVESMHKKEVFLKDIVIHGIPTGPLHFSCNSWITSKAQCKDRRIFFTTKVISKQTLSFAWILSYNF